ncbi:DUF1634 domain-containing protein [Thermus islandicus]|uniref:DUF1634 domain-containing protein n=1 Tax=Thermus islandicus TaxID=540988 RepID=UPI0003B5AC95|nr:DUF1634 domain-containing protein [Thermus islandicus]
MALLLSLVLRGGVLLSALLVLLGGAGELWAHGAAPVGAILQAAPGAQSGSPFALMLEAWQGRPEALVRLGLLLLLLTPVARVALAAILFLLEGDAFYALVALWVLGLLVLSLMGLI